WGEDADDLATSLPRLRERLADAGRDPADLQVAGQLPAVLGDDGELDVDATMAAVPVLVDAGVTDFRASLRIPPDPGAAEEHLLRVVGAFRAAAGRSRLRS
ncbi:MAG TPA: LLM class F420-dependent oxidoreductase, partial [Acidimicrobiales bacterium]|nr:LLM class F420-dependent oxidoreductase [Acidimicrobiales bacterium]